MNKGWLKMSGMQLVKDFDGYVILVDWGNIANCSYEESVAEIVPSVAQRVVDLIGSFNFDPERIEIIGHSFGGQIAGLVGASLDGRLERITGEYYLWFYRGYLHGKSQILDLGNQLNFFFFKLSHLLDLVMTNQKLV